MAMHAARRPQGAARDVARAAPRDALRGHRGAAQGEAGVHDARGARCLPGVWIRARPAYTRDADNEAPRLANDAFSRARRPGLIAARGGRRQLGGGAGRESAVFAPPPPRRADDDAALVAAARKVRGHRRGVAGRADRAAPEEEPRRFAHRFLEKANALLDAGGECPRF